MASDGVSIREAVGDDFEYVFDLILELRASERETGKVDKKELRDIFKRFLASSERSIYVAEKGGAVIGLITLTTYESLYEDKAWVLVDELVVKEGYRGRGTGSRLLDEAFRFAREKQCGGVALTADEENTSAVELYRSYGFRRTDIVLEKELDGEASDG
jgi:ribosomal protein S18 acetylase RimI-like enzyme